ncbi:MAG: hypothetical protein GQ562_07315 [Anaerolineales bacterium]|nr:hypothetical protein [Anaerolineales bacterium]
MPEPFIFISTYTIKEGKIEEYSAFTCEVVELIHSNEPRLLAYSTYASEDGTKATTVQVHPDADSMMFHMQLMREKLDSTHKFLDTESITFCGELNDQVLEMVRQIAGSGVTLNVNPQQLGGFTRLMSG